MPDGGPLVASGTGDPVPANFSPIPRIAPPPLGSEIDGGELQSSMLAAAPELRLPERSGDGSREDMAVNPLGEL
jgi:hypothetical protein